MYRDLCWLGVKGDYQVLTPPFIYSTKKTYLILFQEHIVLEYPTLVFLQPIVAQSFIFISQ